MRRHARRPWMFRQMAPRYLPAYLIKGSLITAKYLPAPTILKYSLQAVTVLLKDLPNITIQDGRLYTMYTYGLAGHTDTLAFGTRVIVNK